MKIASLLPHLKVYGGVRSYIEMGNEFVKQGHSFTIFHSDGTPPAWLPYNGTTAPISVAKTSPQDVVICGDTGMLPLLSEIPSKLKIMEILGPRYAERYRELYRPEFTVIGIQSDWKQYLPGIPGYTVLRGINTDIFYPVPVEKNPSIFTICAFGRLRKAIKGTRFVIKAVKAIEDYPIRLVLFDDQPITIPWWTRIGMSIETVINPSQEILASTYCRSDIFVSAELSAGYSHTTAEAMACGVPVICTTSGTVDFAFHEKTAYVIPLSDANAIEYALRRLINDSQLRKKLGDAGRMEIQKYTWQYAVSRFLEIFTQI